MSKRKKNSREPAQVAELVLKYLDANELPRFIWLSTTELTAFLLNKPITELNVREVCNVTNALMRIEDYYGDESKTLAGIDRHSPLKGSPFETDLIKVYPSLQEVISIPDNLREHCHKVLGTEPISKQLRAFTSEEFRQRFSVGKEFDIRLSQEIASKCMLSDIRYNLKTREIQFVIFGRDDYSLSDLKDNLEYWKDNQWNPFGVYE